MEGTTISYAAKKLNFKESSARLIINTFLESNRLFPKKIKKSPMDLKEPRKTVRKEKLRIFNDQRLKELRKIYHPTLENEKSKEKKI